MWGGVSCGCDLTLELGNHNRGRLEPYRLVVFSCPVEGGTAGSNNLTSRYCVALGYILRVEWDLLGELTTLQTTLICLKMFIRAREIACHQGDEQNFTPGPT